MNKIVFEEEWVEARKALLKKEKEFTALRDQLSQQRRDLPWVAVKECVFEFKGEYYNIPASIIKPKPIQKPHIPIYLGGFSPHIFTRIVKYDTNGWLGGIGGPLEHLENLMKMIKENANRANKDPNNFQVILLAFPNIVDSNSRTTHEEGQGSPLTGTIDEIGHDVKRIKDIGISHHIWI